MIEGQEDVSWDDWRALARACEDHGLEALFRSDHYLSVEGRGDRGSLDAWATIAALAAVTSTLHLGTARVPGHLSASLGAREGGGDRRPCLGWPRRAGDGAPVGSRPSTRRTDSPFRPWR